MMNDNFYPWTSSKRTWKYPTRRHPRFRPRTPAIYQCPSRTKHRHGPTNRYPRNHHRNS